MVFVIKKGDSSKKISSILSKLEKESKKAGIDALAFCGIIKLNKDPLSIQKTMRDEWE